MEYKTFYWDEDITLKSAEAFRKGVQSFIKEDSPRLILSLRNVEYINSSGLGVIADAVMQSRKQGKELVVADIQEPISEIFHIVKFSSFIQLFDTEEEAIEFYQKNENRVGL